MNDSIVYDALRTVIDPELGINMVDLGLGYEVKIHEKESLVERVDVLMTLTTPGCPLGGYFLEQVTQSVAGVVNVAPEQVNVQIVFDPPWSQEMISREALAELGM